MVNDHWTWSSRHEVPSDTAATTPVIDALLSRLQDAQWNQRDIFGVHLAVEEALVNAIKHGNLEDPAKCVQVEYRLSDDRVEIRIADEGKGFDLAAVPDPTAADQLELPTGRGIMLMKSFMSEVEYNAVGNAVRMEKCRTVEA
jgi:serine/threonine-protein kinase RsbW